MVVSKNKTMKLGAALITATLGATGIACDGDQPYNPCGFTSDDLITADEFTVDPDFVWACNAHDVSAESDDDMFFFITGDGSGYGVWDGSYDITWEDNGDCTLQITWSSEGSDYPYDVYDILYDDETLSFVMVGEDAEDDTYEVECTKETDI